VTDASLEQAVEKLHWLPLGALEALHAALRDAGVVEIAMVGKVDKSHLLDPSHGLRPDARALALLGRVADRSDDSLFGALAADLAQADIVLLRQDELAPELLAPSGVLAGSPPTEDRLRDLQYGLPVCRAIGRLGIGQCIVVKDQAVVAVEALEGTDATIARAGALAGPGTTVVKLSRPGQDARFDLPAVGPDTIASMQKAGACLLGVEAGRTWIVDREACLEAAAAAGIAVIGVTVEGVAGAEGDEGETFA